MTRDAAAGASSWDVVVVGAGPAGSTLAGLAAARGLRVALVEKSTFPRHKVCGEFISTEGLSALRRLGLLNKLREAGGQPLTDGLLATSSSRKIRFPLPDFPKLPAEAMGFSRASLDAQLLTWAEGQGVVCFQPAQVAQPLLIQDRVCGVVLQHQSEPLVGTVVVGADGRRSALARHLLPGEGDPLQTNTQSWFGLKTHLTRDGVASGHNVELHLFKGGYVGVNAVEGERLNVCMMIRVDALHALGKSPDKVLQTLRDQQPSLGKTLGTGTRCSKWCSVGPLAFGARRASAQGALFVGDAAGTIDPFSGEGISNALLGAELALPFVEAAVAQGSLGPKLAARYQDAWNKKFARVTRRVRWLGRLLENEWLARPALALLSGPAKRWTGPLVSTTRTAYDFRPRDAS